MSITILKTLDEYNTTHPVPHLCIYGNPGVGKTETWLSACRPPLNWKVFMVNMEEKPLPEGLPQEVYAAGGYIADSTSLSDFDLLCREAEKFKPDVIVYDGFTVAHRNTMMDRISDLSDTGRDYFAVQMQTFNAGRALRALGVPFLSTAQETWRPTRVTRGKSTPSSPQGRIVMETVVPENERFYTVDLPNKLQGGFPAMCDAMGRMFWKPPEGLEIGDYRYVKFGRTGREDVKSSYKSHKPGVTIPYGSNGAFLLLYPWLKDVGRLTEEMQQYYDKIQKEIKLGNQ